MVNVGLNYYSIIFELILLIQNSLNQITNLLFFGGLSLFDNDLNFSSILDLVTNQYSDQLRGYFIFTVELSASLKYN